MSEAIECTLCSTRFAVCEDDPDATVSDVVEHAARVHGCDPRLAAGVMRLIDDADDAAVTL